MRWKMLAAKAQLVVVVKPVLSQSATSISRSDQYEKQGMQPGAAVLPYAAHLRRRQQK